LDFINERISKTIPVIIVSGHNEYGIIALKKGVVDYILKPLITSELETAINKANSFIKNNRNTVNKDSDKLIILNKGSFQVLHIKDIIYFESEGNYTKIHLSDGQVILSSKTLKIFEDEIKNNTIIRISRSILFNTSYMIGFKSVNNKKYVVIKNNHLLEVSLNRWEEFQEFLNRQYNVL
jgi:two-component system LytT family response regulator